MSKLTKNATKLQDLATVWGIMMDCRTDERIRHLEPTFRKVYQELQDAIGGNSPWNPLPEEKKWKK